MSTLRVKLTRQLNGSEGVYKEGREYAFPEAMAKSLVSQGAAEPVGWKYGGPIGTSPSVSKSKAQTPSTPSRTGGTENAAGTGGEEKAAKRTGKLED